MYFPKPSLNENDLAIIERASTASRAYSAGQYVSWHGRTGRVKAAILQGAALADNLFDYDGDGALNLIRSIPLSITSSDPSNGNYQIGNLPDGAVPFLFKPDANSIDCNYNIFHSKATLKWYVHCSTFGSGDRTSGSVSGTVYYFMY